MTCCGDARRAQRSTSRPAGSAGVQRPPVDRRPEPNLETPVDFEYLGSRALVVMGQGTRRFYRFARHGARVAVDGRDRESLARVPGLREVSR